MLTQPMIAHENSLSGPLAKIIVDPCVKRNTDEKLDLLITVLRQQYHCFGMALPLEMVAGGISCARKISKLHTKEVVPQIYSVLYVLNQDSLNKC